MRQSGNPERIQESAAFGKADVEQITRSPFDGATCIDQTAQRFVQHQRDTDSTSQSSESIYLFMWNRLFH